MPLALHFLDTSSTCDFKVLKWLAVPYLRAVTLNPHMVRAGPYFKHLLLGSLFIILSDLKSAYDIC